MIKKDYKIVAVKMIKFVIVFLLADIVLGSVAKQLFFSQKTGKYARTTHVVHDTKADIVVFGSSHAHRHYIPKVIDEELQSTCYNAGAEGQQLLYHTALLKMLVKRSTPKLIVLNIDENFLYTSKVAYDRLSDLHPYYDDYREELKPTLGLRSKLIDFKLFFKSYQANSTIMHVIRYYLSPQEDDHGYRPLFGKLNKNKIPKSKPEEVKEYQEFIDDNFVNALKDFIATSKSKQIKLVFVTSPTFYEVDNVTNKSFTMIREISKEEKVPLLNFFNHELFMNKPSLFHDYSHLNNDGALLFTKQVTNEIKKMKLLK